MPAKKEFTGVPLSEIANDKEKKIFFFLRTYKNGKVKRYEDKNFKALAKTRQELLDKEAAKAKKAFEKKLPKAEIKVLKKSSVKGGLGSTSGGNTELMMLRRKIILEAKMKGLGDMQIKDLISAEFGISLVHVSKEISLAEEEIRKSSIVTHEEILLSHIDRFETLYSKFREEGADSYALKALRSKENVAGLHDQNVNIQINNYMDREFNIDILPAEKQHRLKELLSKIKVI